MIDGFGAKKPHLNPPYICKLPTTWLVCNLNPDFGTVKTLCSKKQFKGIKGVGSNCKFEPTIRGKVKKRNVFFHRWQ
ncbi:MAG: hypothetical protein A2W17_10235 [Planctomycetes bacterium RBG_16_41_13]|nr:MAG: hypothetical protein A2W17_10235 [Planctomycetes bacterium RBG_16_41_13]